MENEVSLTFGELEAMLAAVHDIDQTKRTAFQSRLKNFHRLKYPIGFRASKGRATAYSALQVIDMALAVELTQLGLPPERATWVLSYNRWPTLMAIEIAASVLAANPLGFDEEGGLSDELLSMFIFFDPAALYPLTLGLPAKFVPDLDEAANSFFYGGIGIVRESIGRWTGGPVSRISLINVTGMIGWIVASPYDLGSTDDVAYRRTVFQQLAAEARSSRTNWEGGEEAEANYVGGLLEREDITDPVKLAQRVNIPMERAARYIQEEAVFKARRADDSNT